MADLEVPGLLLIEGRPIRVTVATPTPEEAYEMRPLFEQWERAKHGTRQEGYDALYRLVERWALLVTVEPGQELQTELTSATALLRHYWMKGKLPGSVPDQLYQMGLEALRRAAVHHGRDAGGVH